ncbi:TetR/AcrR family transcriptional regulator [Rhodococcus sp. (in: high G+C Gram-positive bacteria)]|uniref:TetR/AcrR family transcriptional regulator n=1 Tax=unclassified Rhodococcus (in: high G+C Gram-positive bacteria) TaxID=192944 RepID=UPI00146A9B0A|nr:TetR/AcrR family transcriptional regulator [Rhodococcus sp. (in: high G+C Gram-positive bacteria)]MBF0662435.1 TetR family transcriptional regulator [Rhodococcus sp. (in: high G+C Gram-positive bacteria)]NME78086.1 TetR/AcrR family transcriptional regulator [Rhodococcus sp. 105337]
MRAPSAKQRIFIEAGRREFVRNGYGSSSIRTIAHEAGVSLSALYYHYKNKQELLLATLMDGVDTYDAVCDAELAESGDDATEQLRAFVRGNVAFRTQFPDHARMIATEVRNLEPEGARLYEERRRAGRRRIRDIIDAGIEEGVFTTRYPDDCRRSILAMTSAIANWYDPTGPDTPQVIAERYAELSLNLLCPGGVPVPASNGRDGR